MNWKLGFSDENFKAGIIKKMLQQSIKNTLETNKRMRNLSNKIEVKKREREPKGNCRMKMQN